MSDSPLIALLAKHGKSVTWLAAQLGLTRSAVSRKIGGSRPWKLEEAKRAVEILKSLNKKAGYDMLEKP